MHVVTLGSRPTPIGRWQIPPCGSVDVRKGAKRKYLE